MNNGKILAIRLIGDPILSKECKDLDLIRYKKRKVSRYM